MGSIDERRADAEREGGGKREKPSLELRGESESALRGSSGVRWAVHQSGSVLKLRSLSFIMRDSGVHSRIFSWGLIRPDICFTGCSGFMIGLNRSEVGMRGENCYQAVASTQGRGDVRTCRRWVQRRGQMWGRPGERATEPGGELDEGWGRREKWSLASGCHGRACGVGFSRQTSLEGFRLAKVQHLHAKWYCYISASLQAKLMRM